MTARVFLDTNVLLDHLLGREPHAEDAGQVWAMVERGEIVGCVAAISFNFVYYVVRHEAGERSARRALSGMRDLFEIVAVDAQSIHQAIDSDFSDVEDAIQHAAAVRAGAAPIITRDTTGFRRSSLPVMSPKAFLKSLPRG